ncbi:MAG: class I SAM-dependent methyltransferase [Aquaticitalea sp.]
MINKIKSYIYQFSHGKFGGAIVETLGNLLVVLRPKKARELSESGLTIVLKDSMSISERLMRRAILKKLEHSEDYNSLAELHQNYWVHKGTDVFSQTVNTYDNDFLPNWSFIFDIAENEILSGPAHFDTLVEIGVGNGRVLDYLSSKFSTIDRFIGLDLSPAQIEINKQTYRSHKKLEFVTADALEWIKKNGNKQTIYVTSGGVLEYFTEAQLKELLNFLNSLGKIIFIAIEPNDVKHDFKSGLNSQLYGHERSFSHNYPKLFKDAGFSLWHMSQKSPVLGEHILTFIGAKN